MDWSIVPFPGRMARHEWADRLGGRFSAPHRHKFTVDR